MGYLEDFSLLNKMIDPAGCIGTTDYGRPVRKSPSLQSRKSTPNPKFLATAVAYFVCHIGPNFQISLTHAINWVSVVRALRYVCKLPRISLRLLVSRISLQPSTLKCCVPKCEKGSLLPMVVLITSMNLLPAIETAKL